MARVPFKLKSGNNTSFKMMGSSPVKSLLGETDKGLVDAAKDAAMAGVPDQDAIDEINRRKMESIEKGKGAAISGSIEGLSEALTELVKSKDDDDDDDGDEDDGDDKK